MKRHIVYAMLSLAAVTGARAQPVTPPAMVAAGEPGTPAPTKNASAPALLQWRGAIALSTAGGEKCLLVARRQSQIVAIELSPLLVGPRPSASAPSDIVISSATSGQRNGQPNAASTWNRNQAQFSNPTTAAIAASSPALPGLNATPGTYASSRSWRNARVEADREAAAAREPREVVATNGKTYRTYGHFNTASTQVVTAVSDEPLCQ